MKLSYLLTLTGAALALTLTPLASNAQDQGGGRGNRGGGNFDPAQWQQRMMERTKEQLEITDDTEWKAIEPLITKVNEARRENMALNLGGMGRGGRGGGPGGGGGMFGEPNPAIEGLQKAIESKASANELKSAMAKVREARKAAEEKLKKAQDELKKVLTTRQEAILLSNGTLS
jgi:Spy/CpxP family protein refolding chaperone